MGGELDWIRLAGLVDPVGYWNNSRFGVGVICVLW